MKKSMILFAASLLFFACGSDDGGSGGSGGNQDAAVLLSPENNAECTTGTQVSGTQSSVTFQWNAAPDTETYFVYVKNLVSQNTQQYNAGINTMYDLTLEKGTPYSWYVSAKKTTGTSVKSDVWKFYVAGDAVSNYAPFPAEAVAPAMSASVYGPAITVQWSGGDPDNDIEEYKLYLDTTTNPTALVGTTAQQSLPGVAVTSGATYYWKVVSIDEAGNSATSPVYQFKVL